VASTLLALGEWLFETTRQERITMDSFPRRPEHVLTAQEKTTLRGELFINRELVGLDLSGSDLRDARFEHMVLNECSLAGADLRGARFVHCHLRGVDLSGALLSESRFDGTMFDDSVVMMASDRAHIECTGGTFRHAHSSLR
jgi:uncharacterized protein YjbI with pentapeptide repeats